MAEMGRSRKSQSQLRTKIILKNEIMFKTIKSLYRNITEKDNIITKPSNSKPAKKSFYDLKSAI